MMTLGIMPKKNEPEPAEEAAAQVLVRLAREHGLALTGSEGSQAFIKSVLETALNDEMSEHLGPEKQREPDDRDPTTFAMEHRPRRY